MKDRRDKILDVAVALAEEGGFENVRQRDVAANAGVALGTLYKRFRSKEDILCAALERETEVLERRMELNPAPGKTPVERITAFFQIITRGLCRKPKYARAVVRAMASGEEGVAQTVASYQGRLTGLIIAAMRGVGRLSFADATTTPPSKKETKLAFLLQQLWYASLVGWSAGLISQNDVIEQVKGQPCSSCAVSKASPDSIRCGVVGTDVLQGGRVTMSRFPFPRYPNGWFQVAYSDELPVGGVLPLKYFGKDMVLFRGDDGAAKVLDAHCPHLGAHLGYGGRMEGNCIRCPFHAWQFDGTGKCTTVPYSDKPPPGRAKIKPWYVNEVNGLIMVWNHMQGEAPSWEIPPVVEFGSEEWTPYDKRRWKIKTHNQEMAENAVDSAHFHYVHGTVEKPKSDAFQEGHILRVVSETKMRTPMGKVTGQVESISYGFGYAATRFTGIVETLLIAGTTAIDEDYVDVRFSFMVKKGANKDVTSTVGAHFMAEIERQLGQDIPIWENKIYVNPPLVVDGDGPIGIFRRWVKQFYTDPKPGLLPVLEASAE